MNLLVPGALGLLALVGPLLVLYMLRSRRRPVTVSSTMLWARAQQNVTSAVPWKRLDLTTLLLLQLLVLALFVLSLARPFFTEPTLLGPHAVLVVDVSGSMARSDRFQSALAHATELARDASEANVVSIVEAGNEARVVTSFARSPTAVSEALAQLEPTGGEADLSGAIRLARGLATPDRPTNIVLLSDGGSHDLPEEPVLAATHLRFDREEPNVGIAAFTLDEPSDGSARAFLSVANHTDEARTVDFDVLVDDIPVSTVTFAVPAASIVDRTFAVDAPPGSLVEVARRGEPDGLALDDRAWVMLSEPQVRQAVILGQGSPFLAALVRITPGFEISDEAGADVKIVDRAPVGVIDRPTWLIRPDELPPGLRLTGTVENAVTTFQAPGEPLLDDVDLSELVVAEAQVVEATGWFPIVRAGDVPLVLVGEVEGRRAVYFTFDITHSNLPILVSFPIFGAAVLEWLGGVTTSATESAPAGTPIPLAAPLDSQIEIVMPGGEVRTASPDASSFVDTGTPGVYRVRYAKSDGSVAAGPVVVRSFVAEEASARPRSIETATDQEGPAELTGIIREFAPLFIALVLALMLLEWWVGHQRPLPARRPT